MVMSKLRQVGIVSDHCLDDFGNNNRCTPCRHRASLCLAFGIVWNVRSVSLGIWLVSVHTVTGRT